MTGQAHQTDAASATKGVVARLRVVLEMIKFSHTIFALPFALLAASLASERNGGWRWLDLVGVLLCMVFARSAAMAFNRWADREVDSLNPRTQNRALPAGVLTPAQVMVFVAVSSAGFLASTSVFWFSSANLWPMILAAPVLIFLLAYSTTKRWTKWSHVWLGAALALSPIAAWIAVRGNVELTPLLLGAAIVCWVTGFDIMYACQDLDVDRTLGLQSIPSSFGFEGAMAIARGAHLLLLLVLFAFGWFTPELRMWYWTGFAGVAVLLAVEHWFVRGRDLLRINLAFFHVNGVISLGLLLTTLADLYLGGQ